MSASTPLRIHEVLRQLEQRYGAGAVLPAARHGVRPGSWSTGWGRLDEALSSSGWVRGRIVELLSPPGGGAQRFYIPTLRAVQERGGRVAVLDPLHQFDPLVLTREGVDISEILLVRAREAPVQLAALEYLLRKQAVDLVVLDPTEGLGKRGLMLLSERLRRFARLVSTAGAVLMVRSHTPHHRALHYFASMRVQVDPSGISLLKSRFGDEARQFLWTEI